MLGSWVVLLATIHSRLGAELESGKRPLPLVFPRRPVSYRTPNAFLIVALISWPRIHHCLVAKAPLRILAVQADRCRAANHGSI